MPKLQTQPRKKLAKLAQPGYAGLISLREARDIAAQITRNARLRKAWGFEGESSYPLAAIAERAYPEDQNAARMHIRLQMDEEKNRTAVKSPTVHAAPKKPARPAKKDAPRATGIMKTAKQVPAGPAKKTAIAKKVARAPLTSARAKPAAKELAAKTPPAKARATSARVPAAMKTKPVQGRFPDEKMPAQVASLRVVVKQPIPVGAREPPAGDTKKAGVGKKGAEPPAPKVTKKVAVTSAPRRRPTLQQARP